MNADGSGRPRLAEAIELLRSMPPFLEAAIEGASPERLRYKPSPDDFSLHEQACHLRDLEREGYLARVRRMLAEPCPELAPFDGAAVARERDYHAQDARIAAQEFSAARRELTGLLAPLTEDDMQREAIFDGRAIRMADLLGMMLEHDRGHRDEIARLLDAPGAG